MASLNSVPPSRGIAHAKGLDTLCKVATHGWAEPWAAQQLAGLLIAALLLPALPGCSVISWALSTPASGTDMDNPVASGDDQAIAPSDTAAAQPQEPAGSAAIRPAGLADKADKADTAAATEASPTPPPPTPPSTPPAAAVEQALADAPVARAVPAVPALAVTSAEQVTAALPRAVNYAVLMRSFRDELAAYSFAADLREKLGITQGLDDPERDVAVTIHGRQYFVLAGNWTDEATARQRAQRLKRAVGGTPSAYRKPESSGR